MIICEYSCFQHNSGPILDTISKTNDMLEIITAKHRNVYATLQ